MKGTNDDHGCTASAQPVIETRPARAPIHILRVIRSFYILGSTISVAM